MIIEGTWAVEGGQLRRQRSHGGTEHVLHTADGDRLVHPIDAHRLIRAAEAQKAQDGEALKQDTLTVLHQYRSDLLYRPEPESRVRRLEMIDALIARIEGGEA